MLMSDRGGEWKEITWSFESTNYSGIHMERIRKPMKNLNQDNQ
jgi:transcription initiation factor IIE alpha subunit